eukprot:12934465-Alexandrium_andersonii.AAC.1
MPRRRRGAVVGAAESGATATRKPGATVVGRAAAPGRRPRRSRRRSRRPRQWRPTGARPAVRLAQPSVQRVETARAGKRC